jgi:hypothetical protein
MRIVKTRTRSGLSGWRGKLRDVYADLDEFQAYCGVYGNHQRLGFNSPRAAWAANPLIEGSVDPTDYRRVKGKP